MKRLVLIPFIAMTVALLFIASQGQARFEMRTPVQARASHTGPWPYGIIPRAPVVTAQRANPGASGEERLAKLVSSQLKNALPKKKRTTAAAKQARREPLSLVHAGSPSYLRASFCMAPLDNEFTSLKFLDSMVPARESLVTAPAGNDLIWRPYTNAEAFLLHSNTGVNQTIYMDFNGHTVAGTQWNTDFNSGNPFTMPAWSMDANRAAFSPAELTKIITLWRMVAEDFMPFDVNVTTEDPGAAALINSGGADTAWGIRVVIGPDPGTVVSGTPNAWPVAGGIAYLGSFGANVDICCFAWNGDSSPTPEASLPVTVSHETGHTFGLQHDGTAALGYYSGHGSGALTWGPIMGAPFGMNVTQWSRNTYPSANNPEDDLTIITTGHGFGYRPDDYGNTPATAFALNTPGQGTLNTTYGIIERSTDIDYFLFYANAGPVTINVDPLPVGANLDIQADLYDAAATLISSNNGINVLNASFALSLPANAAYYLKVTCVGRANTGAPDFGYPTYGSLGSYSISGTVTPYVPPPPPPPPPPGGGGGGGGNEGNFSGGPTTGGGGGGGGEGGFGFGFAPTRSDPNAAERPAILQGPEAVAGEGNYRVINASNRQPTIGQADPGADSGLAPIGWALVAGVGIAVGAFLVVREGCFGFGG